VREQDQEAASGTTRQHKRAVGSSSSAPPASDPSAKSTKHDKKSESSSSDTMLPRTTRSNSAATHEEPAVAASSRKHAGRASRQNQADAPAKTSAEESHAGNVHAAGKEHVAAESSSSPRTAHPRATSTSGHDVTVPTKPAAAAHKSGAQNSKAVSHASPSVAGTKQAGVASSAGAQNVMSDAPPKTRKAAACAALEPASGSKSACGDARKDKSGQDTAKAVNHGGGSSCSASAQSKKRGVEHADDYDCQSAGTHDSSTRSNKKPKLDADSSPGRNHAVQHAHGEANRKAHSRSCNNTDSARVFVDSCALGSHARKRQIPEACESECDAKHAVGGSPGPGNLGACMRDPMCAGGAFRHDSFQGAIVCVSIWVYVCMYVYVCICMRV
jgi:hypothetical protein